MGKQGIASALENVIGENVTQQKLELKQACRLRAEVLKDMWPQVVRSWERNVLVLTISFCSSVQHKQFYRVPESDHSVIVINQDKNKTAA